MRKNAAFLLLAMLFLGVHCTKDSAAISVNDMLVGKKWYLEQRKILRKTDSVLIYQYNYIGLPTFSFEIEKRNSDSSYRDSDGYKGSHQVVESANKISLTIVPKNSGAAQEARNYTIRHVGFDYLVIQYEDDVFDHRLFFSSRL